MEIKFKINVHTLMEIDYIVCVGITQYGVYLQVVVNKGVSMVICATTSIESGLTREAVKPIVGVAAVCGLWAVALNTMGSPLLNTTNKGCHAASRSVRHSMIGYLCGTGNRLSNVVNKGYKNDKSKKYSWQLSKMRVWKPCAL